MKIELTQSAFKDIGDILTFYDEQGIGPKGKEIAADILKKCERLAAHPDSGRVVPEFDMPFIREIIVPPFRVVYRRTLNKIFIIRVWRSERILKL